ncbi:dTDP-glucose 4,6-dehydratase [Micromonospora sp. NPDC051141]|uniref:dTDP-glucose 4,6-dehydratase n=1 Tax=Micromonospora sp. NPDC051141 TaxID=3364284 RepID=UPI003795E8BC
MTMQESEPRRRKTQRVLVTGGAGFIGSHFVKRLLAAGGVEVTVVDALTYAAHLGNLSAALDDGLVTFVQGTLDDRRLVDRLVAEHDAVVHFAAESHVTRSLGDAGSFVQTNVVGTFHLLDAARSYGVDKFVHVSTDEVYGPLRTGTAGEGDPLRPTVPYAASKAAAEQIAMSYFHTYDVPVCITRSVNNYGPGQHHEKLVPLFVTRLLSGQKVTLHGRGQHVRNWLHVEDNCQGIDLVMRRGLPGEAYNIGGGTYLTNREMTALLLAEIGADWDRVEYGPDRLANDIRYSVDPRKARDDLGYQPVWDLAAGLAQTVQWYRDNPDRWESPQLAATTTTPNGPGHVG